MARTPSNQKKSNARLEVEKIVFEYLRVVNLEFESTNIQTLPNNKEGKINISELSKNMGLTEGQRKNHMYKDDDIVKEINRHAIIQEIKPIGESKYNESLNEDARHQIAQQSRRSKMSEEQLVEVQSQNEQFVIENRKLQARIDQLEAQINEFFVSGQLL